MAGVRVHQSMSDDTELASRPRPKYVLLKRHLRAELADGRRYFKSRAVARKTALSAKEAGAYFTKLESSDDEFVVERWGYSTGTTWHVERRSQ